MSRVVVVGGGVAGLAAAGRAARTGHHVELYDAGSYDPETSRRGAWGEVVADVDRLPVDLPAETVREIETIAVHAHGGHGQDTRRVATLQTPDAAVIDRGDIERAWRRQLPETVTVHENHRVSPEAFDRLCGTADLVVDASGPAPVAASAAGIAVPPSPAVKTLSTQTTGEFDAYFPEPAAIVGRPGKLFVTTKSRTRATYGVGIEIDRDSNDQADAYPALVEFCDAAGLPVPDRSELRVGLEPLLGSRSPARCQFHHNGAAVRLVGDAAGLVSGMNQFGLCRAVDSAVAAVEAWQRPGSYTSWLRRHTWRRRLQTRLLKPIEHRAGTGRLLGGLDRLPGGLPLSWF